MIKVYNENLTQIHSFQAHTNRVNLIKISPFSNGNHVATVSNDNTVKIWNLTSNWTLIRTYTDHTEDVRGLDFINASTIASGGFDSKIKLWIISTGVTTRTINTDSNVYTLQLLSDYFYLAAGLENTNIQIYNINNGILIVTLK